MATKVIILGQEEKQQTKKPIEFVKYIESESEIYDTSSSPSKFKNIELISKNYCNGYDLMFAYNNDRNEQKMTLLILGHYNDGVVE